MHMRCYARDGSEITLDQWMELIANLDYKRVALTEFPDGTTISTVWLGMDHQWGDGPMQIFETMVFGSALDQSQWRYASEEQALRGHAETLELVRLELGIHTLEAEEPAPKPREDAS